MKRLEAILAVAMALSLAGCVVHGKPKPVAATPAPPQPEPTAAAPTPPPEPLSIPQTQVKLPPEQPLTSEALQTLQPPEQTPPATTNANTRPARRPPPQTTTPRTETPPAAAPPVAPPATAEPARPQVQEMLDPAERNRLQGLADAHKREIRQWLTPPRARRLNKDTVNRIQSFLKASDDAEQKGDMREANALAERALILMRELQGGQ